MAEWYRSYCHKLYNEGYIEEAKTQSKVGEHKVEESELSQEPSETEVKESIKRLKQ